MPNPTWTKWIIVDDQLTTRRATTHPFDIFEHELESSLIGLCDRLPHFSITDNSQWIFDRMDEMPESSFSFKCRWKRIFIRGYLSESFVTFSLFYKRKKNTHTFCFMFFANKFFKPIITLQISHFLSFIMFRKLTLAPNWLQSHLLDDRLPMLELHV